MSFNESLEVEIFDEERSRETVIDFVQTHPGCITQDIVDGQTEIGRKKVFRILEDLKKEKIFNEEEQREELETKSFLSTRQIPIV